MIVFAHVPKTAGTSITSVLVRFMTEIVGVPEHQILLYGRRIPYSDITPLESELQDIRFASGHFRETRYAYLLRSAPFVLASTRPPFERYRSGLEHVFRLLQIGLLDAYPDRLRAGKKFLETIGGHRHNTDVIEHAMRSYREHDGPNIERSRVLTFRGRYVAHARIGSNEIERLCEQLSRSVDNSADVFHLLQEVSMENTGQLGFFSDYKNEEIAVLQQCFERVFADELILTGFMDEAIPSLFQTEPWDRFTERLFAGRTHRELWQTPLVPERTTHSSNST